MRETGVIVSLAEWIIDDTYVFLFFLYLFTFPRRPWKRKEFPWELRKKSFSSYIKLFWEFALTLFFIYRVEPGWKENRRYETGVIHDPLGQPTVTADSDFRFILQFWELGRTDIMWKYSDQYRPSGSRKQKITLWKSSRICVKRFL